MTASYVISMRKAQSEGVGLAILLGWYPEAASAHQIWGLMVQTRFSLSFCRRAHEGLVEEDLSMMVSGSDVHS